MESFGIRLWREEGPKKSWLILKDHFDQAQEQYIPMSRKSSKNARSSFKTLTQKGSIHNVEAGTVNLGVIQRYCLSLQR